MLRTSEFVCAVTAVTTATPLAPRADNVLRSRAMPAPPLESEPPITSTTSLAPGIANRPPRTAPRCRARPHAAGRQRARPASRFCSRERRVYPLRLFLSHFQSRPPQPVRLSQTREPGPPELNEARR